MKYYSTCEWRDATDGHTYRKGDPFPFDGREIPAERLEALQTGRNRAELRLIWADKSSDGPAEAPKAETPVEAKKGQEKAPAKKAPVKKAPAKKPPVKKSQEKK